MHRVHTVSEVRSAEAALMQELPPHELMHRAAFGLAVEVCDVLRDVRGSVAGGRVVGLIGAGNNGSDTLWALSLLAVRGVSVAAVAVTRSRQSDLTDAKFAAAGGIWTSLYESTDADVFVDGIAGLGSSRAVDAEVLDFLAEQRFAGAAVVAVDVPSGLLCDLATPALAADGQPGAVEADVTVTFGCLKPCHVLDPGLDYCGEVRLVDIGLDPYLPTPQMHLVGDLLVEDFWPEPQPDDSKYSRGVVNVIAGSVTYPGAGLLAAKAARWSGAGMVRHVGAGALFNPEAASVVLQPDSRIGSQADAYVVGCGLDESKSSRKAVKAALKTEQPLVLDAEALNWLARDEKLRSRLQRRQALSVLTPHVGEFRRLCDAFSISGEVGSQTALALAAATGSVVYLKGSVGVVATPEGELLITRRTSEHLATAGTGDVLAGLLGGLLAATRPAGNWALALATASAVLVHSIAAEIVVDDGEPLTAEELEQALPIAIADTLA